tara:strand:+ start:7496 stop:8848 length:1353 start_codon:yes stop_codon:yes gene_type:complete
MAIRDALIPNGTGSSVRNDIELTFQSIKGNNSTGTLPSVGDATLTDYMFVAHTTGSILKVNNAGTSQTASDNFVPIIDVSTGVSSGTHIASAGTSSIPGYRFMNNAGTTALQTGMGLPVDTRIGFFIQGQEKASVFSDGKFSIGTTAPSEKLHVDGGCAKISNNTSVAYLQIHQTNSQNNNEVYLDLATDAHPDYAARFIREAGGTNADSNLLHRGTGNFSIHTREEADIVFKTHDQTRLSVTGAGNNEGSLISHTVTRNITDTVGYAFLTSPNNNGVGFDGCCLVKDATGLGTVLFLNRKVDQTVGVTGGNLIELEYNDGAVGVITTNGSSTTYNPNSDYRLKQDVSNIDNAITKIKSLRPVTFRWKNNPDLGYDNGFIAHEVQETGYFDHIVTGVKDGTKKSYSDPERDVPDYQGVDYSKFTPMLVAGLQEAVAKIETLEAKVAALEA